MVGMHALIIEDNLDSIDILGRLLTKAGVTSAAVSQPTQLQEVHLANVDVVFLDLDMPGMDGYDVYDLLRNEYGMTVPIIAYTVHTNEKATARRMGFNGMVAKPVDPVCFRDQLQRILQGESMWDDC
ncbi:MAG: response regulator [Anaerolineae bacterium]